MLRRKILVQNKEQSITITSSSGLSDEEIEKMVKDAEANAEEDKKRREEVELRNEADQLVFQTEKTLKDLGDKVEQEEKDKAEAAKDKLKAAIESDNIDEIRTAKDELQEIVMALTTKMYEQAAQAAQANQGAEGGDAGAEKKDDNVVDAEYEEVKEEEKK